MIEIRIHLPTVPGVRRWRHLMALAETMTEANAEWMGGELDKADGMRAEGYEVPDPPCCLSCARPKVRYIPPPTGDRQNCQNYWSGPEILARGRATCMDAAAFDAGCARAQGKKADVVLEPMGNPRVQGDPYSTLDFHAVAIIDGERVDSSAKLTQAGTCG